MENTGMPEYVWPVHQSVHQAERHDSGASSTPVHRRRRKTAAWRYVDGSSGVLGLEIIVALVIDELARSGGDGGALQKDQKKVNKTLSWEQ